jgi:hypothetical protein
MNGKLETTSFVIRLSGPSSCYIPTPHTSTGSSFTEAVRAIFGQGGFQTEIGMKSSDLDEIFFAISGIADLCLGFRAWGQLYSMVLD